MPIPTQSDPKTLLSTLIKKQLIIFGQDSTFSQLANIPEISVDTEGNITKLSGQTEVVTKKLMKQWYALSPYLTQKIAQPILMQITPVS